MRTILFLFSTLLMLGALALSEDALQRIITNNSDESVDIASLPKPVRERVASLRAGMTRAQIEKHFEQDGGLSTATHQRYYIRHVFVAKKLVMVELFFQAAGIPDTVYADPKLATEWWSKHEWTGNSSRDILRGISKPFLS